MKKYKVSTYTAISAVIRGILLLGVNFIVSLYIHLYSFKSLYYINLINAKETKTNLLFHQGLRPVHAVETLCVALGWSIFDILWDMLFVVAFKMTSLKYSQDALLVIMLVQIGTVLGFFFFRLLGAHTDVFN